MPQHDGIIDNQAGAAFRADLNNFILAIIANSSGATAPATTYAYQWWADTTTGLLKIRNAANSAWITVGTLADAYLGHAALTANNLFTGAGNTFQGRQNTAFAVGGTVNAITFYNAPAFTALVDMMEFGGRATGANTSTTPTVNLDGLGAITIVKGNGAALAAGDIEGSAHELMFRYNATSGKAVLLNPKAAGAASGTVIKSTEGTPCTTFTSFTAVVPYDNTAPQYGEMTEKTSVSHTPSNASNRLRVHMMVPWQSNSTSNSNIYAAIFKNGTGDALKFGGIKLDAADSPVALYLTAEMAAGGTSAITFNGCFGVGSGTGYLNGSSSGALFNGTAGVTMWVEEMQA